MALVSASRGEGFDKVFQFLGGATHTGPRAPALMQLPVIQDIPKCRAWAAQVGAGGKYHAPAPPEWARRLDAIFLHPIVGPLVFLLVVIGVFQTIFTGAKPAMEAVSSAIDWSGQWLGTMIPNATLRSLIVDGVWKGVGSVVQFLPQILALFLFIGIP